MNVNLGTNPLVSVIIPMFNAQSTIEKTVYSATTQSYRNLEIIVVDDCSTDNGYELVERIAKFDSRINLIRTHANSGRPAVPRNLGASVANGEYYAFLDSDDLWFKSKVSRQIQALESNKSVAALHSCLWYFNRRKPLIGLLFLPSKEQMRTTHQSLTERNQIACSSMIIRSSVFREFSGFSELKNLCAVEDYEFWLRISSSLKIGALPEILGRYAYRESSLSRVGDMNARLKILESETGLSLDHQRDRFEKLRNRIRTFPGCLSLAITTLYKVKLNLRPRVTL